MSRDDRQRELNRMRAIATGLLVAMSGLFLLASWLQADYPWLGYVRAFAEASMVGALADWFAVAALFRHPFGLPIPHTAVIPRNKERIGDSLGRFVEEHFLPPEVIRSHLADIDYAAHLGRWLADARHAEQIAEYLAGLLPDLRRSFDQGEQTGSLLGNWLRDFVHQIDLVQVSGQFLDALIAGHLHQEFLDTILRHGAAFLSEHEVLIRQRIREHTGWLWKRLHLDERAFNSIMNALHQLLYEVEMDAGHELRQRFDHSVRAIVAKLKEPGRYREQADAIGREVTGNPAFQAFLGELWQSAQDRVLSDLADPESEMRRRLHQMLVGLGEALQRDTALRSRLNGWLLEAIAEMIDSRRSQLAKLIPDTIRTWDADTMARRLELQVGRDLQFIRINGTLVGGMVGLLIYALSRLIG